MTLAQPGTGVRRAGPGGVSEDRALGNEAGIGLARFSELASRFSAVPVWRELVADMLTPVGAFQAMVGDGPGFLLESVDHGERWSRFSFVGRSPVATLVATGNEVVTTGAALPDTIECDQGMLRCIETLLAAFRSPSLSELPPLHGGLVGYLGYDVVREVERLGPPPPDDLGLADAVVSVIGELAAFDHWRQRVTLVDNVLFGTGDTPRPQSQTAPDDALAKRYLASEARLDVLQSDLERPIREPLLAPPEPSSTLADHELRRTMSAEAYRAAVEVAKEYVHAGDAFQIVLSQRFDFDLGCAPFDVYRVLRQVNPSPYMFFLRQGGVSVVGASPEPMVQLLGDKVVSRPIAGTRPRGATEEEDRLLEAELVEHPKEVAEHVMLVDLARNDVGRVVRFGTEKVDELMTVERYSHVMHLTSGVSGTLRCGSGPIDVLRATLPAGTVSGAPKVRAMQIIDELEPTKRGPYAGVVGYVDFSGNLDTAIAIRTLVATDDGRAFVQAGAGIVADSDPESEDLECRAKAAAVLTAVAGARQLARERSAVRTPGSMPNSEPSEP